MKNYSGAKYGLLTANKFVGRRKGHTFWEFECECGLKVERAVQSLKHANNPTCGVGKHSPYWRGYEDISSEYFTTIKHSAKEKNLELSVDMKYLWSLFVAQNKKCKFTNEVLSFGTQYSKKDRTASLDRIDSTKGYVKGNLQWVHKDVNKLKKNFSDKQFIKICRLVVANLKEN